MDSSTFKSPKNGQLAIGLIYFLVSRDYSCISQESDDGVVTVTYFKRGEPIWPSARIDGSIVFPAGTDLDLMLHFLEGQS